MPGRLNAARNWPEIGIKGRQSDERAANVMTLRDLLSKFSLDEMLYYLSMRHELQSKPFKARELRKLYGLALSELLALELNQGEICGELSCDFFVENTDEWINLGFAVMLRWKESGETFDGVEAWPWEDLIDLPVEQTSLDRYGEWACAAEILWKVTICGYSESRVNEMESVLARLFEELAEELVSSDPDDESEYEVNPLDVKATLDWFANAPDCVKRLVRNRISSDVIDEDDKRLALAKTLEKFKEIVGYEEPKTDDITRLLSMARELDDEQLALAKTLEKLKEIVGCNELKTDDITRLLLRMTRELDNDDELLLLKALDGDLGNSGEHENQTPI